MMAMVAVGRELWALMSLSAPEKEQMGFLMALGSAGMAGEEGHCLFCRSVSVRASLKGILVRDNLSPSGSLTLHFN